NDFRTAFPAGMANAIAKIGNTSGRTTTMAPPRSRRVLSAEEEAERRALRHELAALADALVDARAADRAVLSERLRRAVDEHADLLSAQDDLDRLLRYMVNDLSVEGALVDTLYYARQLAAVADRLPN